jgi:type II secretory pathway pseudopilin PulG
MTSGLSTPDHGQIAERGQFRRAEGFSLVEVIVATGLLAAALVTLAELFGQATRSNLDSRMTSIATVLAQSKVEELRVAAAVGVSPATALDVNTPGFVDYIDRFGRTLEGGANPPPGALYARRWSVQPLAGNPSALVIQVLVTRNLAAGVRARGSGARLAGEARLVAMKNADGT